MTVVYDDHVLEIAGTTIEVRHPIKDVVEIGDRVLVVLDPAPDAEDSLNVLAFDTSGTKLWEIEAVKSTHSDTETPYTSVLGMEGQIAAYNWNSHRYELALETGLVTELGPIDDSLKRDSCGAEVPPCQG